MTGHIYLIKNKDLYKIGVTTDFKNRMSVLVDNLLESFRIGIEDLEWMSEETKKRALTKLKKLNVKIRYPDVWEEYDGLELSPDDLYGNMQRAAAFGFSIFNLVI